MVTMSLCMIVCNVDAVPNGCLKTALAPEVDSVGKESPSGRIKNARPIEAAAACREKG